MNRKVGVLVAAMVLAAQLGSPVAAQQATLEQLSDIETLLSENDVAGMRAYLEANPNLLEGEGELAILFRRFLAESTDLASYLGFEPDLSESVQAFTAIDVPDPLEEGSDDGEEPDGDPDGDLGPEPSY